MRLATLTAATLACSLLAGGAQAQSFLEHMAKRAVTSAAGEALGRAMTGRGGQAQAPQASPDAAAGTAASLPTPARRADGDNAPEAEGMQGLSEEDRLRACTARYPTRGLSGDAWMRRSAQHTACMGPNWGDGG
ncbi:MAG: hypothetical protein EON90_05465 [Brevundimonas sp.]|nr:MAG: hypothetical protein EON90_05465 [Brevundimonas sp.]